MRGIATFTRLGREGRFCNGTFQIAGTIGIARKNGLTPQFPLWRNYNGLDFEPDLDIDCYKRFTNPLPPLQITDGLTYVPIPWDHRGGYFDISVSGNVDIHGHLQSEKYFSHCIDEVRWYMEMIGEKPTEDACCLHYRAGDYGPQASPQHPNGNEYHPRMALDYYRPAMAQFGSQQKFVVFSDDIEGAKQMLGTAPNIEYAEGGTYFDDFRRMKKCAHFIIANSSFSAFAAMLGDASDKRVVAPFPWFGGPYRDPRNGLNPKDIYSSGWTVIDYTTQEIKRAA